MNSRRTGALVLVCAVLGGGNAYSQETGQVGISMGYPGSLGIVWHVAPRVAIRPEISIAQTSGDVTSNPPLNTSQSTDAWQIGIGLSGLFYVAQWDALRAYVSPRFMYSRNTTSSSSSLSTGDGTTRGYLTEGSFGAQYSLGRRFGVFGELGLAYTATTSSSNISTSTLPLPSPATVVESHSHGVSMRSDIGVIFYLTK